MLALQIFIALSYIVNACYSTRLPLEVYELKTTHKVAIGVGVTNVAADAAITGGNVIQTAKTTNQQQQQQQHQNLEYSIIEELHNPKVYTTKVSHQILHNNNNNNNSNNNNSNDENSHQHTINATNNDDDDAGNKDTDNDEDYDDEQPIFKSLINKESQEDPQQQTDHRRSRQMLSSHKYHTIGLDGKQASSSSSSSVIMRDHHLKDVRILYQVGDSESDLPICATNAVCSKIDLYETPWIERQCRCPTTIVAASPEIIIHHHHHHHHHHEHHHHHQQQQQQQQDHSLGHKDKAPQAQHSSKFNHQNKHILLDAASAAAAAAAHMNDKKFETFHLKKLMHKLGAVYEDDINLPPPPHANVNNDYNNLLAEEEDNSALPIDNAEQTAADSELSNMLKKKQQHNLLYATVGSGTRHSTAHISADKISFIGGCPSGLGIEDGHTIADKTRHYKLCQPVHRLPVCRHFRDYTWTLTTSAEINSTEQIVHCRCPKNSVTYLTKREQVDSNNPNAGYKYLFACSPLTRLRCQRKQPCKLFTVRKRQEFIDEVNINALCQCPKGHQCPRHHTQSSVIAGETFLEDNIQTYSGYCMAND